MSKTLSLCWQWQPDLCELFPTDAVVMQTVLDNVGGLCMVGDSLMGQFKEALARIGLKRCEYTPAAVLVNLFTLRVMSPAQYTDCLASHHAWDDVETARHAAQANTMQPTLSPTQCLPVEPPPPGKELKYHWELRFQAWTSAIQGCDVLLLETGHHWHKNDPEAAHYQHMVESVLGYLQSTFTGRVVYVTSHRGHYG